MDSRAYAAGGVLNRGDGRLRALQLWYGRVVVDLASVVRELEGELRERGGRTQAHPVGELLVAGKLPGAALATFVLESDRIARAVVSQLRVPPFMSGVAMVIHPVAEVEAPVLLADSIIAPTGRARALLDAAGPGILNPTFADDFGIPLAHVVDGCEGVRRSTVPAWLAPLSGGGGRRCEASAARRIGWRTSSFATCTRISRGSRGRRARTTRLRHSATRSPRGPFAIRASQRPRAALARARVRGA